MPYAVKNNKSWRMISPEMALTADETYSDDRPVEQPPTETEILAELSRVVQLHLDRVAGERGYSSMMAACTYAASKKAKWKGEAIACVDWRDAVWEKAIAIMDECKSGKREIPTAGDLLAELPGMVWP